MVGVGNARRPTIAAIDHGGRTHVTLMTVGCSAHIAIHVGQALGGLGEGAIVVWLLAKGAQVPARQPSAAEAS